MTIFAKISIIDVKGILGNMSLLSVMIHLVKGTVPQSRKTEAATGCVLLIKVFLKILKNSQENSSEKFQNVSNKVVGAQLNKVTFLG